jgi:hypothetical protein
MIYIDLQPLSTTGLMHVIALQGQHTINPTALPWDKPENQ